jgi:hypothetical protein
MNQGLSILRARCGITLELTRAEHKAFKAEKPDKHERLDEAAGPRRGGIIAPHIRRGHVPQAKETSHATYWYRLGENSKPSLHPD